MVTREAGYFAFPGTPAEMNAGLAFFMDALGLPQGEGPSVSLGAEAEALSRGLLREATESILRPLRPGDRDEHGRLLPTSSMTVPTVDGLAKRFLHFVREAFESAGTPLVRKWPWKGGAPYAVALSHDVDLPIKWRLRTALSYAVRRRDFGGMVARLRRRPDPWWTYDTILDMERRAGVRSTFFLAAGGRHRLDPTYQIEDRRMRALPQELRRLGWEVGLHGSYLASEEPGRLREEKRRLEECVKMEVDVYRQHYLRFPSALLAGLREAGFRYDSSLGTSHSAGYLSGVSTPHSLEGIWELPLSLMDGCIDPARHPMFESDQSRQETVSALLSSALAGSGLVVVDWHQNYFDEDEFPGFQGLYAQILSQSREAHRGGVRDLASWWEVRHSARFVRQKDGGWLLTGEDLPAGFTITVSGGTLETDHRVVIRNLADEVLITFQEPGPWAFRVG